MYKIGLVGAGGRMGKEIRTLLNSYDLLITVAVVSSEGKNEYIATKDEKMVTDWREAFNGTDGVIDFSSASLTLDLLNYASEVKYPGVVFIGTAGYDEGKVTTTAIKASKYGKICLMKNTAIGVVYLKAALKAILGFKPKAEIAVREIHHNKKIDSPSGTAIDLIKLGEKEGYKCQTNSVRAGNIIGEHEVSLFFEEEVIELKHRALNRSLFAKGALDIVRRLFSVDGACYFDDKNIIELMASSL